MWEAVAHTLGGLCASLVLVVSPERIILSGGVMNRTSLYPKVRVGGLACGRACVRAGVGVSVRVSVRVRVRALVPVILCSSATVTACWYCIPQFDLFTPGVHAAAAAAFVTAPGTVVASTLSLFHVLM